MKDMLYAVWLAGTEAVIEKLPSAPTVKGLGATAPAGRPCTVMDSEGWPTPKMRAGDGPPDHASLDASTAWSAKTHLEGPQRVLQGAARARVA